MKTVGITTDGKLVVDGVGREYFQHGVPLSLSFDNLSNNNLVPHFPKLYEELRDNGMPHKRIMHLLHEQMFDTYGNDFREVVLSRLESIYGTAK